MPYNNDCFQICRDLLTRSLETSRSTRLVSIWSRSPLYIRVLASCMPLSWCQDLPFYGFPSRDWWSDQNNQYISQTYLCKYIDYAQSNIFKWLSMAEFTTNNTANPSTQMSPFFANKGFHPQMTLGPPQPIAVNASQRLKLSNKDGNDFATKMLCANLTMAKAQQILSANLNRSPAPVYRVRDEVYLDTRNITTSQLMKKLNCKFIACRVKKMLESHSY